MPTLTFKKLSNLSEAEAAWKALSPNKVLYDDWDFRYAYYKYFNYPLEFIAAYAADELVGLLPLMWNPEKNYLEFFMCVDYMEDNQLFVKPGYEYVKKELISQIDRPAYLEYLTTPEFPGSELYDYNYSIDLTGMHSYEDFMETYLSKDTRSNISSQIRKITTFNPLITKGEALDLEIMSHWNKIRFGESSSYNDRPYWKEFINDIVQIFPAMITTVIIDGEKAGVGLALRYKDTCFGINAGYNPEISNLGKYMTLLKIDTAIKDGCTNYNAGSGAYGWKEDFHLIKRPFYKLEIKK